MTTLRSSQKGLIRIKQARRERGWTIDNPRWLVEASQKLDPDRTWTEAWALCRRPLAANLEAFFRRTRTH